MEVLSWGANSHGQLGQGTVSEQCATPQPVIKTWTGDIKEISGGGGHTLMINENGWIYGCGWNHQRQLGFMDKNIEDNHCHTFTRNWDLSGITFIKICTGWDSSAAITDKNALYLWGSNAYGQLGLPREYFPNSLKPMQLELKGKTISMGMRHTILVDVNGCVWSTGCGKRGQLGLGDSVLNLDTFKKLPGIKNIENAVCGQHHTLAWSKVDCTLYTWGDNSHGQLGLNPNQYCRVYLPIKVAVLSDCVGNIRQIFTGWTHSSVLLDNGKVIYWGRNNYGQLGCDELPRGQDSNVISFKDLAVQKLSVGSEHSVCLLEDGSVWAWGWNEHANTGTGLPSPDNVKQPLSVKINCQNIVSIYSGAGHNFIVHR